MKKKTKVKSHNMKKENINLRDKILERKIKFYQLENLYKQSINKRKQVDVICNISNIQL